MGEFEGTAAVVTGGTRGIGRAIVKELSRRGARVAFSYTKNQELAESLVAEVEAEGGKAIAFRADVTDSKVAEGMIQEVKT